ncbi:uncharacterized protein LOC128861276 isoform X3 [Anastrepha ludens]|uniref:uncharacterized protein LOC128861276 isoform X3 n=1 Tax=Anastrepha ludens TaxID=28586 RepID=UPI0023AEBADC|nr:uncharacterized protein LOC128861276 isoform X3 [Anastrepha ludens]
MWKMFEDTIYCSECTNFLEPPPKFEIPAPPRPPYIGTPSNCKEKVMSLKIQKAWDHDKCEAIPIFDTSFYKRQSLQTSAVIAVFCLLFILVALILSLFVCKLPTRVLVAKKCARGVLSDVIWIVLSYTYELSLFFFYLNYNFRYIFWGLEGKIYSNANFSNIFNFFKLLHVLFGKNTCH